MVPMESKASHLCEDCRQPITGITNIIPAYGGDYHSKQGGTLELDDGCRRLRTQYAAWGSLTVQERELVQTRFAHRLFPDDLAVTSLMRVARLLVKAQLVAASVDPTLRPPCRSCAGSGVYNPGMARDPSCWKCGGTGKIFRPIPTHFAKYLIALQTFRKGEQA